MKRMISLGLLLTVAAACSPAPDDIDSVLENRTEVILSGIRSGDMSAVVKLFTEDALYSPSGDALLSDRAALTAYWNSVLESPARDAVLEVVKVERLAPDAFVEIHPYTVFDADGNRLVRRLRLASLAQDRRTVVDCIRHLEFLTDQGPGFSF